MIVLKIPLFLKIHQFLLLKTGHEKYLTLGLTPTLGLVIA